MTTASCIWCDHTETGEGYEPYDAIRAHQIAAHGHRKQRCGCEYTADGKRVPGAALPERMCWWTCDIHSPAYLRQLVEWQYANHEARRWAEPLPDPDQPSLLEAS